MTGVRAKLTAVPKLYTMSKQKKEAVSKAAVWTAFTTMVLAVVIGSMMLGAVAFISFTVLLTVI